MSLPTTIFTQVPDWSGVFNYFFYHLRVWTRDLLVLLAQDGILFALGKWAIIVEPCKGFIYFVSEMIIRPIGPVWSVELPGQLKSPRQATIRFS